MHEKTIDAYRKLANFLDIENLNDFGPDDIAMMLNSIFHKMDTEYDVKIKAMEHINGILKKIAFLHQTQGKIHFFRIELGKKKKYQSKRILTFYSDNANIMKEVLMRMGVESNVWIKRIA